MRNISFPQSLKYWLGIVVFGIVSGLGVQFAHAWVNPASGPPNGNVAGPLTTGNVTQTKAGGNIILGGGGGLTAGGDIITGTKMKTPQLCLGTDCRGVWPTGGTASAVGDNLGNHTATLDLNMSGKNVKNALGIFATGFIGTSVFLSGVLTGHDANFNGHIAVNNLTVGPPNTSNRTQLATFNGTLGANAINTYQINVYGTGYATGGFQTGSDARFKKDVTNLNNALETTLALQGVNYTFKTNEFPARHFDDSKQIGFVAQDVEKIVPELVKTDSEGYKSIDYGKMTPILVEAIKTQQAEIEQLKNRLSALEETK